MEGLSDELLLLIFREVGWEGTARVVSAVCRRWHAVSVDESLWRSFFLSRWPTPPPPAALPHDGWRAAFVRETASQAWWRDLTFAPRASPCKRLSRVPPTAASHGLSVQLVLLGCSGVGKSCLLVRYCHDHFVTEWDSDCMGRKSVVVDGVQRVVEITDTGDPEDYHTPIVVRVRTDLKHLPLILVETKVDVPDEREVPVEAGPAAAEAMGCFFARVSNKTREGVDEVMHAAARLALATSTGQMDDLIVVEAQARPAKKKQKEKRAHGKRCLMS